MERRLASAASSQPKGLVDSKITGEVIVCGVRNLRRGGASGAFGALLEEADDDTWDVSSEGDVCVICLDALLSIPRARNGETLSVLGCAHCLHTTCASKVRESGLGFTNGALRCPICRRESTLLTNYPLVLLGKSPSGKLRELPEVENNDGPKGGTKPTSRGGGKRSRKQQLFDASGDSLLNPMAYKLIELGFNPDESVLALEASGGDADLAVALLLGN